MMNKTDETQEAAQETTTLPPALLSADGAFEPGWFTRFDELQPYAATLSKFRRPEALAKSYANLEKMKGYPDPQDAARMQAFREAMGLPSAAQDFALQRPDDTPDELWNPELVQALGSVAYEYGVPPRALTALAERYTAEGRRHLERLHHDAEQAVEQADAELQQSWGPAYESNMNSIAAFLNTMGRRAGVDVEQLMQNPALRANPDFARLMLEAAGLMEEAPLHTGNQPDRRQEAHRIAHDPTHPLHEAYMRTSHPQHRYANDQYDRLAFGHGS